MNELLPMASLDEAYKLPLQRKHYDGGSDSYSNPYKTHGNLERGSNSYYATPQKKSHATLSPNNPYAKHINAAPQSYEGGGDYASYTNVPNPSTESPVGRAFSESYKSAPYPAAAEHSHGDGAFHLYDCPACKRDMSALISSIVGDVLKNVGMEAYTNYFPDRNSGSTYPFIGGGLKPPSPNNWIPHINRNTRDIAFVIGGVLVLFMMFLVVVRAMK